jgi:hypothetical protein
VIYPRYKADRIKWALQAAEKLVRAVGRGFIPGTRLLESMGASAPEACFSSISEKSSSFSAASLAHGYIARKILAAREVFPQPLEVVDESSSKERTETPCAPSAKIGRALARNDAFTNL